MAMSPGSARRSCSSKTWRDEAEGALGHDVPDAVGRRDAGGLLAAVLQRVEGEVGEAGYVVIGRVDAEDAALVARAVALVERELMTENTSCGAAIRSDHAARWTSAA